MNDVANTKCCPCLLELYTGVAEWHWHQWNKHYNLYWLNCLFY